MSSLHDMALIKIYKQVEILLERLNKLALNEMEKRGIDVEEEADAEHVQSI